MKQGKIFIAILTILIITIGATAHNYTPETTYEKCLTQKIHETKQTNKIQPNPIHQSIHKCTTRPLTLLEQELIKNNTQLTQQQNQTHQKYIQCIEHYTELQDDFTQLITQDYQKKQNNTH